MALKDKASPATQSKPVAAGTWRFQRREQNVTGLSWAVAIAGTFLLVGTVGLLWPEPHFEITLGGRAGLGASDVETTELTMAELQTMEESPEVANETVVQEELPEPVEVPVELPDLPELAEALVTEDVFTVPAAPKIEQVLQPVDPTLPKPKPKVQPKPAAAQPRRAASRVVSANGTQGTGGGDGGSQATGSGNGKGKMPKPNYPSSARARGVSGTIKLSLSIDPSGKVESATPVSSQGGFFSQEQESIARQVERTWSFPPGPARKFVVPIVFKLN